MHSSPGWLASALIVLVLAGFAVVPATVGFLRGCRVPRTEVGATPRRRSVLAVVTWSLAGVLMLGVVTVSALGAGAMSTMFLAGFAAFVFSGPAAKLLAIRIRTAPAAAWRTAGGLAVVVTLLLGTGATHWPLRLHFALVRPEFEAVAADARANDPRSIGGFDILRIDRDDDGVVSFWTYLEAAGLTGFAWFPPGTRRYNSWSVIDLGGGWSYYEGD